MKVFKLTIFLLFTIPGLTQVKDTTTTQPKTEIGRVDLKIGTIIKKESIDIFSYEPKGLFSTLGPIKAEILNITDALTGITVSGLRLSNSYSAFVDVDEIPGLLKYIEFLIKNESEKPENYTEYNYNFRDLKVYAYYSKDIYKKSGPSWHYGIKTDIYSGSHSGAELKTLIELKDAILKSKEKFKQPFPNF